MVYQIALMEVMNNEKMNWDSFEKRFILWIARVPALFKISEILGPPQVKYIPGRLSIAVHIPLEDLNRMNGGKNPDNQDISCFEKGGAFFTSQLCALLNSVQRLYDL